LGPLESINGILMVGVTTAVLMAVVNNLLRLALEKRAENE
jgi:hypothetical protein